MAPSRRAAASTCAFVSSAIAASSVGADWRDRHSTMAIAVTAATATMTATTATICEASVMDCFYAIRPGRTLRPIEQRENVYSVELAAKATDRLH